MTEKVIVRFEGDGGGVAELSWGQQEIWCVMRDKGSSLAMGGVRALPSGQTVADVVAALRHLVSRHQALRTTLCFAPDGQIQQVVHPVGEITLDVVEAGDDDPAEVAAAVAARDKNRAFDYEHEWPLRMAVITRHGAATHIAETICHIAADAFGLAALREDFDRHAEQADPVTAMQPMEQAARQRSPGARRAHDASMRYLERLAPSVPDRQFAESADPRKPRFWQLTCQSSAGYRAARILAARLGLSTSPVLLAAFATALSSITISSERVAFHLVVSNRFRPGFAGSVSPVMASCLCVVEVAGAPFDEVAKRAWQAALGAYKHAYYDMAGKRNLCERIAAEHGSDPDWNVLFNDRRVRSREVADATPGVQDKVLDALRSLRDELSRTTLTWGARNDMPEQKIFLSVCEAPGTLCLELWADTHFVKPADMSDLLKRMEGVLVDAASGSGTTGDEAETVTGNPAAAGTGP